MSERRAASLLISPTRPANVKRTAEQRGVAVASGRDHGGHDAATYRRPPFAVRAGIGSKQANQLEPPQHTHPGRVRTTTGRRLRPNSATRLRFSSPINHPRRSLGSIPEVVAVLGMPQIGGTVGLSQRLPDSCYDTLSSSGGRYVSPSRRACSASISSRVNVVRIVAGP